MTRAARGLSMLAAMAVVAGCKAKEDQPPPNFQTPAAPAAPMPAKFALEDFGRLRYLEGRWRGSMTNGRSFYESYHFLDDSTIAQGGHTDSTFKTKSDSSRIVFRAGAVIDSGSHASIAEKLDGTVVDFRSAPDYHFSWTKEGPDAWTARLIRRNPDGTESQTLYPMKRVP